MGGYLSQLLTDCERMLDLLDEEPDVRDEPGARDLVVTEGVVEFGACSTCPLLLVRTLMPLLQTTFTFRTARTTVRR